MEIKISIALHIIGLVLWVGGLLIVTRFFKLFTVTEGQSPQLGRLLQRMYYGYVVPGFLIALATGIFQISYRGADFYMKQGWFHAKLGLVLALFVVTILSGINLQKIRRGKLLSKAQVGALHGITSLVLLVVVILTLINSSLVQ